MLRHLLLSCASILVIAASAPALASSSVPQTISPQDNPTSASNEDLVDDPAINAALESFSIEVGMLMTGEVRAALDAAGGDPVEAVDALSYILARYQTQADELAATLTRSVDERLAHETDPERRVSISATSAILGEMIHGQPAMMMVDALKFDAAVSDLSHPMPAGLAAMFDATKAFGADLNGLRAQVLTGGDGDALALALAPRAEGLAQMILTVPTGDDGWSPGAALALAEQIRAAPANVAGHAKGPAPQPGVVLDILINAEGDRFLSLATAVREEMRAAVQTSDGAHDNQRLEAIIAQRQPEVDTVTHRLKALTDLWIASASNDEERAERTSARQSLDQIGDLEALASHVRQNSAGR